MGVEARKQNPNAFADSMLKREIQIETSSVITSDACSVLFTDGEGEEERKILGGKIQKTAFGRDSRNSYKTRFHISIGEVFTILGAFNREIEGEDYVPRIRQLTKHRDEFNKAVDRAIAKGFRFPKDVQAKHPFASFVWDFAKSQIGRAGRH